MEREMSFQEAVSGLMAGDFTRLAPLFDTPTTESSCAITRWYEEGRFSREPEALGEAFTCACFNGRATVVNYFLAHGVDPRGGAHTGLNAFHWAANRGQKEVVAILIRYESSLEVSNAYGGTVLGSAVWAAVHETKPDHLSIIQSLLDAGADVRRADYPSGSEQVDAILRRYRTDRGQNA
jgi:hypothetical protein